MLVEECLFKDNTAWGNKVDPLLFPDAGSKHGKGYCWSVEREYSKRTGRRV